MVASQRIHAAWLSLDEQDNEPHSFWMYVIAALQTLAPDLGRQSYELLQSPQPPSILVVLPDLLNEIANLPGPAVLVLDDYHVYSRPPRSTTRWRMSWTICPGHCISLCPRAPIRHFRWRACAPAINRRAPRRRSALFYDEAVAFVNQAMNLDLPPGAVESLLRRTEGWAAGLHCAALSLRGQADPSGYIETFTGGHHYVLEYLVDEVLTRQPERVSAFLPRPASWNGFCGPLCDAVAGDTDGAAQLAELYRG